MIRSDTFNSSFYLDDKPTLPSTYIFDDVYKNATNKSKYSRNPKYMYFNTLLRMKQKLGDGQVYNNVFNTPRRKQESLQEKKQLMPIYHV
jgi:hypothetical protein